jgi:hypothetical protein
VIATRSYEFLVEEIEFGNEELLGVRSDFGVES